MSKSSHELLNELRERLLRAGVAPRHVRRYMNELGDHLADLRAEEESEGRSPADAESAALVRLGSMDDLARAMVGQRQFQSWCVRAPWAMFSLAPILFLAGSYLIALLILWSGWKIFLPGSDTPFVRIDGSSIADVLAIFYFQVGKWLYFLAPVLVGWGIGLIAARQRLQAVWPFVGLVLIALMGGAARVHAGRTAVPGGLGHIRMDFAFGPSVQGSVFHALVIFSVAVLPYIIWRFRKAHFFSA
jgi:hypothetical protein